MKIKLYHINLKSNNVKIKMYNKIKEHIIYIWIYNRKYNKTYSINTKYITKIKIHITWV